MTLASPAPILDMDHDRYLIKQPDGSVLPYTRTSSFAKTLDNGYGIALWKLRLLALALGRREDLAAMAAGLSYENKAELDEIIDFALDFVGANAKRNYGTAIHKFTEPGADMDFVPTRMVPDVNAWNETLKLEGVTVIDTEVHVVNDSYQVAGRLDHILHHPDYGYVVGDKKTGALQFPYVAIQLAMYANSQRYDHVTGARSPLDVSHDIALAAYIPRGVGACALEPVDIRAGYLACKTAAEARVWQKVDFTVKPDEITQAMQSLRKGGLIEDPIIALIHATTTVDNLEGVWSLNRHAWKDEHSAAAAAHKRKLENKKEKVTA